ncbi:hypothetical protein RCO27_04815 [Sphingosinicella sp. LHD-64]|uniref:hypothetical protein n=1 Tax=Sphingosinicella sp. LHD-64 TaxID=3072139 RepID=UPI002810669D|nr:hypothetical protein [Sphingosinicella sp. LHD-64]MDQ8755544.1 hypothetical protein [Sphingosinicella sp. LHD-64]
MSSARLSTLWIGPALGAVERACLRSALRQGHPVSLYCYRTPDGVPDGVEIRDAADVLPETRILHHHTGSVSLFSNLFRYALLRRGPGTWIDTDVCLLRPIDSGEPYLFGRQSPAILNGAVLRPPPDSPLLEPLIRLFDETEIPFWLSPAEQDAAAIRLRETGRAGLSLMPWGTAGPGALTALAARAGFGSLALPEATFYPVSYQRAGWILNPAIRLDDVVRPETIAVHLWNELIKSCKEAPAPDGSFLARLQAEGRP